MKNLLLAATALVAMAASASAADLPRRAFAPEPVPAALPPAFTWTGFYFGGYGAGVLAGDFRVVDPFFPASVAQSAGGYSAGGTVGANYQFTPGSGIVVGIEGDVGYSDIHNRVGVDVPGFGGVQLVSKTDGLAATARGRVGYAFDRVMVYATGGYAYTDVKFAVAGYDAGGLAFPVFVGAAKGGLDGYTLGGGIEAAVLGNMSVKAEYLYSDYDAKAFRSVGNGGAGIVGGKLDTHVLKVGLNYRFDALGGFFGR